MKPVEDEEESVDAIAAELEKSDPEVKKAGVKSPKKGSAKKGKKRANDSSDDDSDYEKPKKKAAPRKKKAPGEKGPRKAGGYTAPVKLSEELADIVGGDEMPRHEVSSDYFLSFP